MATFKVCDHDCTHWITDVEQLTEIESFNFNQKTEGRPASDEVLNALMEAQKKRKQGSGLPPVYTVVSFQGMSTAIGKVVRVVVRHQDKPQIWIIPAGSGYLISDTGKTIDKL